MAQALTTQEQLTAAIVEVRGEYLADDYETAAAINRGACEDFAADAIRRARKASDTSLIGDIDVSMFVMPAEEGDDNNHGYPMNREALDEYGITPPDGLTHDDLDAVSSYALFSPGTHIWIHMEGRHYDAEAPEGVDSFLDLPFFQRIIQRWINDGRPQPRPAPVAIQP